MTPEIGQSLSLSLSLSHTHMYTSSSSGRVELPHTELLTDHSLLAHTAFHPENVVVCSLWLRNLDEEYLQEKKNVRCVKEPKGASKAALPEETIR